MALSLSRQRSPPGLGDCHPHNFERASARDHALGCRGRQPSDAQINHLLDGEAVRDHDRFGRAIAGCGKQFERAAAVGLGAVATAAGLGHGQVAAVLGRCLKDIRRPETVRGRTGMPSVARELRSHCRPRSLHTPRAFGQPMANGQSNACGVVESGERRR